MTTFLRRLEAKLKEPYILACACLILAWLAAWLYAFPNLYGWLTDDAMTFSRILQYERGGANVLDIQWFHAYMWFVMFLPWIGHWAVPSHVIPRAWERTPEFRALILYTIFLHAIFLGIVAYFFQKVCDNALVCAGALILFMTSPTLLLYADLLDSRYLGLLAGLPAMLVLLSQYERIDRSISRGQMLLGFLLPGFLIGVGQAIHYTELYLLVPFALVYWYYVFAGDWRARVKWQKLFVFCLGIAAWIVPVQLLSLRYHPFQDSMIGTIVFQVDNHQSPYGRVEDLFIWLGMFWDEMGAPMILAVASGAFVLWTDRWRPSYVSRFHARLMVATTALASLYFLFSSSYPFYRQVSGLQLLYAIFAVVAIERAVHYMPQLTARGRLFAACVFFAAIVFVPSVLRSPEVFMAQQGLGRAVNFAYDAVGPKHVFFVATYDWDPHPRAILSRRDFDRLSSADYIVTDYPIFFHVKYPDIFASMYEAKPVASFPTEWCTRELWAELREYFAFRKWFDEPSNCNAEVYRVADIRKAARGKPLEVLSVRADSSLSASQGPSRVLTERNPSLPLDDNYFGLSVYKDVWASRASTGPHWLELTFAKPEKIGAVTIVPPDYQAPPNFSYFEYSGRIRAMQIFGVEPRSRAMRLLWSKSGLEDEVIFTATFAPATVRKLRFVVEQTSQPANQIAAVDFIHFPGYVVRLHGARITTRGVSESQRQARRKTPRRRR